MPSINSSARTGQAGEVESRLAPIRQKRGLSAIALAEMIGVSRQTIYAIESGSYVPNTAVALRLAKALDVGLEDIFSLAAEPDEVGLQAHLATMLPGSEPLQPGQPVQLCRVDRRVIAAAPSVVPWYLPESDAIVTGKEGSGGRTRVQSHDGGEGFENRILVAGCDPAMSILARHVKAAGVELVLVHRNSSQSLNLLKEGCVHIAGSHLRDETTGESNIPEITRIFAKNSVTVISFAFWEEGILTAAGNPKHIKGVEDFARQDLRLINREKGAGSRILLDSHLKRLKISHKLVRRYDEIANGHLAAAWEVKAMKADYCIATQAAARVFGLSFIPLISERYDLAIRRQDLELPGVQVLFDVLNRTSFRRELANTGGYETSATGQRVL